MSNRRRVAVLGSTGSVGTQTLEVLKAHPDRFELVGLGAGSDERALAEQAREFPGARTVLGADGARELATANDVDLVLNGIVGAAGLEASIAALEAGKILALANKESLVAGGRVCLDAASRGGGTIVPVDSEHAALGQCLEGYAPDSVESVVLTASGGPFRTREDLSAVTPAEALAHPTWDMGPRITVDCATLFNKGFEVIEAHFLFGFAYDDIDVVVHPQSVVHAMVQFVDGSFVMQAAPTDMRIPIQAALSYPDRIEGAYASLDAAKLGELMFEPLDRSRFPALDIAYEAGRQAQTYPAALNAADEIAVSAFLGGVIEFEAIANVVRAVVEDHDPGDDTALDAVLDADERARRHAQNLIESAA
ncbi:MAG: 1-deoxy-D-xylulose-5-phosphate reductoisomerase [Actinomycetota bacterium]|nr:1-deoxy-D-xylulose-5-phosphate reductoisomerase [Actinomycetota bacterium]